jgi:hypothetical protein
MTTPNQIRAVLETVRAIADAIREAKQISSGHLYAAFMPVVTLDGYEAALALIKGAGLVREDQSRLLTWIGPAKESGVAA